MRQSLVLQKDVVIYARILVLIHFIRLSYLLTHSFLLTHSYSLTLTHSLTHSLLCTYSQEDDLFVCDNENCCSEAHYRCIGYENKADGMNCEWYCTFCMNEYKKLSVSSDFEVACEINKSYSKHARYSLTYSLTHLLTYSLTHSPTYSLVGKIIKR